MKLRTLDEFKIELKEILKKSHPGNIQIAMGDKVFLHYAESHTHEYDDEDNEFMTSMFMSMKYYGEHHDVVVRKEEDDISVSYTDGELSSQLFDFVEDELSDYVKILWDEIDNWTLYIKSEV